jgi:V-type H+-transporting ATPase subunit B
MDSFQTEEEIRAHFAAISSKKLDLMPRLDYKTVVRVDGPLVILDKVKFPK